MRSSDMKDEPRSEYVQLGMPKIAGSETVGNNGCENIGKKKGQKGATEDNEDC